MPVAVNVTHRNALSVPSVCDVCNKSWYGEGEMGEFSDKKD